MVIITFRISITSGATHLNRPVQFYSYTTCGSSADDWIYYQQQHVLGGKHIEAAVGAYLNPYMYKRDFAGDVLTARGGEYYDSR